MQQRQLILLTDKHIALAIVKELRRQGVDVERVEDVGLNKATDHDILVYATSQYRSVLTFDTDFDDLHTQWMSDSRHHCGIFRAVSHLKNADGIGRIVTEVVTYHELIQSGVGKVQDEIYNQFFYIK